MYTVLPLMRPNAALKLPSQPGGSICGEAWRRSAKWIILLQEHSQAKLNLCSHRRLAALDAAVTAVAKGMSALRQLAQPEDGSPPAASAILQEATAAVPEDSCAAVQALMDIDESIIKPQPAATPAKV